MIWQLIATIDETIKSNDPVTNFTWTAAAGFAGLVFMKIYDIVDRWIKFQRECRDRDRDYVMNDQIKGNLQHLNELTQTTNNKLDAHALLMKTYNEGLYQSIVLVCKAAPPRNKTDPKTPMPP